MNLHWKIEKNSFILKSLPYYWRKSVSLSNGILGIPGRMSMNATIDKEFSMIRYIPSESDWLSIQRSYASDNTIGFLHQGSGQLNTYGSSVNKFFLELARNNNVEKVLEIGCGGCLSLKILKDNGFKVMGVDPSEYSLNAAMEFDVDLINENFDPENLDFNPDLILCNDVFEHILNPLEFSTNVYKVLGDNGIFGISTTSSELAISLGDISMMQHQHVNMFSRNSIYKILEKAGFSEIYINKSTYGDNFHIKAIKKNNVKNLSFNDYQVDDLTEYLKKTKSNLESFIKLYKEYSHDLGFYVPTRCFPYLSAVGDYGKSRIFDGNKSWENLYIDGYSKPIENIENKTLKELPNYFFIGSLTFLNPIKNSLIEKGIKEENIFSLSDLIKK